MGVWRSWRMQQLELVGGMGGRDTETRHAPFLVRAPASEAKDLERLGAGWWAVRRWRDGG